MNTGWIKLHRDIKQWEWYSDSLMVHLYLHLLLSANYEARQWRGVCIERGQLVTSTQHLADALHTTLRKIYSRLLRLEEAGVIVRQTKSSYTLITITNYADYQSGSKPNSHENVKQKESKCTQLKDIRNKEDIGINSPLTPQGGKGLGGSKKYCRASEGGQDLSLQTEITTPIPPLAPTPLSPAFEKWLEYKRQKRQSYRNKASLKACYNRLSKYSGGDPKVAMEIIDHSIAMNYSGFFEPKKHSYHHDDRPESITNAAEAENGTRYSTI